MFFQWDFKMFQLINHLAISDAVLNPVMKFLSEDGAYLFYLAVIVYWFIRTKSNRRMVVESLAAASVALGINAIVGLVLYRNRPFVDHHVIQLIQHAANASFPSDHATGAFVIATSIWIWRKRDGWFWLLLAAAISLSRVWTGVHYPSDVIAGLIIGISIAFLVHAVLTRWKLADQIVNSLVGFYEKIESKVWRRNSASRF
ncbi:undecaprenyl-diphosphatase [Neobacillus sp. SM06]|uniref:undecaprenyl-diphosphatase n=1 Tax=Neobacillus sp. SM06 TaxID=3422492 RepID=UPI003D2B6183